MSVSEVKLDAVLAKMDNLLPAKDEQESKKERKNYSVSTWASKISKFCG